MSDQTLTLGTNFQADVKSFADGVKQVRDLLKSLRAEVEQVSKKLAAVNSTAATQGIKNLSESSKKAGAGFRTMYGDMSELQKALGRTEGLSGKYSATLSNLTQGMDKNSLSIKDAEKAMYSTDKVLRTLNRSFSTQLEQSLAGTRSWDNLTGKYDEFAKAANLGTISQKVLRGELKATDASIKGYIQQVTNGRVTFDKFTESKKKSWPIINQVNKAIDAGAMSWQTAARQQAIYQAATQKTTTTTSTLSQKFKEVTGNAKGMNAVWRTMNKAVDDGTMSWQQMSRVQAQWQADHSKASANIQKFTKDIKSQTGEVSLLSRAFTSLGQSMRTIASYGAASAIIYSVTRAFSAGVSEMINYDQALKNIQAISGATTAELEIMDGVMQKVARETKFSTVEIGQAMVLLGQSGFSAAESVSSINAVAMLATGTLSDMTNTADLLTTTIRAYNLQAIEANRVSDIMANAINKSKLTLDKLRIAFNYVGATSSQAGLSVEETAASLMMLANNGLRASTMGTGLRQILAKMLAPTAKVKDVLESVGMSIDAINPGVVGFQKALMNLRAVMVDSKGIVDMSKAFEMFGLRGAQAAAVLIRSLGPTGGFQDALDNVYSVGTAAHMASIQQEGLAIKIKNMADRAKSLALAIGDAGLVGAMKLFIDTIRGALMLMLTFTDTMGGKLALNLAVVTGLVYGLTKALVVLRGAVLSLGMIRLIKDFGLAQGSAMAFSNVMAMLKSPILVIAAAIAGVGVAISWLVNRLDNAIIKHQRLQAEHENASNSLKLYAEAISKTDGVGREYESLLQRLKDEHPELKKVIDENAFSHKELAKAMQEVADTKYMASLVEQAKAVGALQQKLQQQKDAYSNVAFFAQGDNSKKAWDDFIANSDKGKATLEEFNGELKNMAASLFNIHGSEGMQKAVNMVTAALAQSGGTLDEAKANIAEFIKYYEHFIERKAELEASTVVEQVNTFKKAGEVLAINKFIIAEQHEIEKEGFDKKLSALQLAYNQEIRAAQLAAIEKIEVTKKSVEDEMDYRQDSFGRYVDMERNMQDQLVSFRQQGSDQAIQVVRDENGKIISAYDQRKDALRKMSENAVEIVRDENGKIVRIHNEGYARILQASKANAQEMAKTETSEADSLYQQMLDRKLAMVQAFYQRQLLETQGAQEYEKTIVLARYKNETVAIKDLQKIDKDYHKRRIDLRKEELAILEGLLKDEVGRYEEAQAKIISLREELLGIEKSRADSLDAIRYKNLTDYQKYKEDEAKFAKLMAEAIQEAELSAMAKTDVERDLRLEKSKKLYKDAVSAAESLNREVKQGEGIIVSAADAEKKAITAVNQAYDGLALTTQREYELAEARSLSAMQNQENLRAEIVRVKEELQALVNVDWTAQVAIKLDGVKEVDDLLEKLREIRKDTSSTHTQTIVEKTVKQSRWGGFVAGIKRFANGGSLSGYGGGDIVDAKLEPGEYVLRKEAVRNVGVGVLNAMNNLKLGAADIMSSIKARTGGYLMPQIQMHIPKFPRLAYQTGGMVQNSSTQHLGSLNLSINNQEIGKIYAEPDVLNILSKQVQRKNRLRSNR